jgi:glycosyltransferase involved in cell wall biosynthesis
MHVAVVQQTANSTTFGWEQGFELLGHRVTVVTAVEKRQFGGRPGADIRVVPPSNWSRTLSARSSTFHRAVDEIPSYRSAVAALRDLAPDVAIVKVDRARNIVMARALGQLGVPWGLWQEQLPPVSRRWRIAARSGIRPVAFFTVLDSRPGGVSEPRSETPLPRISYVPFVQANRRNVRKRSTGPLRVLVVASFKNHRAKHQWTVLEAASMAGLLDGSVTFTFSGQGRATHEGFLRVQGAARELGVEHLVELRRNVAFVDMADVYASHDVLVLPSVREQFGMAAVEAMAYGLPVIVSDAIGAIGCVRDEETGLTFPVRDIPALSRAMRRLADDSSLRERLSRGAVEFVEANLDARRAAADILRLLGRS